MQKRNYETVFILNPVLSDEQVKEAVQKYTDLIKEHGGEVINEENWGLKSLSHTIEHKSSGFYILLEYTAKPDLIQKIEVEFVRDERVIRFLTSVLDKYAVEYNERRRKGAFNKKDTEKEKEK